MRPTNLSAHIISGWAEFRLKRSRYATPSVMTNQMGGRILPGTATAARMRVISPGNFSIYLPRGLTGAQAAEQIVGHMLGHYHLHYLHTDLSPMAVRCSELDDLIEWEADECSHALAADAGVDSLRAAA